MKTILNSIATMFRSQHLKNKSCYFCLDFSNLFKEHIIIAKIYSLFSIIPYTKQHRDSLGWIEIRHETVPFSLDFPAERL